MKKLRSAVAVIFTAVALVSVSTNAALSANRTFTVPMKAMNGSGEDGNAYFTQLPQGVSVFIMVRNAGPGSEPTYIHAGRCPAPKRIPAVKLHDTVNGLSRSLIAGARLGAYLHHVVLIHQGNRHVSCGDIRYR